PPPLPKKQLQRAESLPEPGAAQPCAGDSAPRSTPCAVALQRQQEGGPSSGLARGPKRLLTKSHSLGEPRGWSCPAAGAAGFGMADGELGQLLEGTAGVCGVVLGCQEAALGRLSARLLEQLVGQEEQQQLLEAELAGKSWAALSILQPQPCCETADAWYFPVGFPLGHSQLVLAAKVSWALGDVPWGLQRALGEQGRQEGGAGQAGRGSSLQATQPALQVLLSPEVPYQTLAGFVQGSHSLHSSSPGHYERLVCLLLLQVCLGLEHLRLQDAVQGDLCPENLLLVQCPRPAPSQQGKEVPLGLSLPRLLISSFLTVRGELSGSRERGWAGGFLPADELSLGMLIYQLLHVDISLGTALGSRSSRLPAIPSLSIYSSGLRRLAGLLLRADPCRRLSVQQARSILQVLLWGPRQELFARSKKTLRLLQSWVQAKRALLLLQQEEKAAGGEGSPGLEEWLCCQYFKEVTEHSLYQATQALY
ncbi:Tyrosine-protein kinase SgK223, partial [Dryobates pubescens]